MDSERPGKKRKTARKAKDVVSLERRNTRSMTTDAARKAVLNTPELLENIISFLSQSDILKAQRLSRQWKNATASSPSIQTKLWLRPQDPTAIPPADFTNERTLTRSPGWGRLTMPIYSRAVSFNPVCFRPKICPIHIFHSHKPNWLSETASNSFRHLVVVRIAFTKESSQQYHQSSWRGMYLTDPPITTSVLHVRNAASAVGYGPHATIQIAIRDHGGLTLGLVYDIIVSSLPSSALGEMAPGFVHLGTLYTTFK